MSCSVYFVSPPKTNMRSAKNNRGFWTSLPEALHQITIVMNHRGIPAG